MYQKIFQIGLKYSNSLGWIFSDLVKYFLPQLILANLIAFFAPGLQATAFFLLSSFVSVSTRGGIIRTRHFRLDFLQSGEISTILTISVICTVLLLTSAIARFWGEKLFINLRFDYTRFCLNRGLDAVVKYWGDLDEESIQLRLSLSSLIKRDSVYCGRIALFVGSIGTPICEFSISLMVALWLYPLLTFTIGILSLLAIRFLYRISVNGHQNSYLREKYNPQVKQEIKEYIISASSSVNTGQSPSNFLERRFPQAENWFKSLSEFILVVPLSRLVTGILTGFIIGVIVFGLGFSFANNSQNITKALVYLVTLKYLIKSCQQIVAYLSTINRFYFQAVRYQNVIRGQLPADIQVNSTLEEDDDF